MENFSDLPIALAPVERRTEGDGDSGRRWSGSAKMTETSRNNNTTRHYCKTHLSMSRSVLGQEGGSHFPSHDHQDLLHVDRRVPAVGAAVIFIGGAAAVIFGGPRVGAGEDEEGERYEPQHRRQAAEEERHRRVPLRAVRGGRRRESSRRGGVGFGGWDF
ncbi:phospho-N-acetylmuramoyl-pentapeptide-transferase [Striga asiatica]|uniref:Phospho-N-acetylmuramoyl-pentapeptide-transferase n=1 Tax=Striga asiatica TaxID=4170 RepID=A0A5A7P5X7_STRAF|nr:phospho-N-acetylmuramoyl-pentapeptide-transferase [Striga asiatica]